MMRRSSILTIAVVVLAIITIPLAIWGRPRSIPLILRKSYTGYYWGDDLFLGRHFYRVEVNDEGVGRWEVDVNGEGWSSYRGWYPDGTLREEGEIWVEFGNFPLEPHPDQHLVRWGNYYRPDGTPGGQIREGSGEQNFWYPDGRPQWSMRIDNYQRQSHQMWGPDGKLISDEKYRDGKVIED